MVICDRSNPSAITIKKQKEPKRAKTKRMMKNLLHPTKTEHYNALNTNWLSES